MAEFMTALPQLTNDSSLQESSGSRRTLSPGTHHSNYHEILDSHNVPDPSTINVPEYPWMKEKKTTKKNNQQGKAAHLFDHRNKQYQRNVPTFQHLSL